MPQASAAVLRSKPSSTSASASIRRAAPLFFSPLAALRSSEAVRSSRVIDTAAPIDAAPLKKPASSQSFTDLGIPYESQSRAIGISPTVPLESFRQCRDGMGGVLPLPDHPCAGLNAAAAKHGVRITISRSVRDFPEPAFCCD